MKRLTISSVAGLAALAIATLAVVPLAGARTDRQAAPAATTIQVKGGEFFYRLSTKSIAKPGKVTFSFKNIGHVAHDFSILGKKTPLIQPGRTTRLVVTFKKKGKYAYKCTVPGHAAAGMRGSFTVR
jgi:plastocyanin